MGDPTQRCYSFLSAILLTLGNLVFGRGAGYLLPVTQGGEGGAAGQGRTFRDEVEGLMNKAYRIAIAAGVMVVSVASFAPAQTPQGQSASVGQKAVASEALVPVEQRATQEQLRTLFEVMRLRQQFEDMMKMLPSVVQQQVRTQMNQLKASMPATKQTTPEQQKALDKLMNKYMEKAATLYPVDEMISDAISVYQRHISQDDADAYISFFSSPPGQHFLDAQPAIMKEYMPIAMERAQRRTRELTAEMAADIVEFRKSVEPAKPVSPK